MDKVGFFCQLGQFRDAAKGKVPSPNLTNKLLIEIIEFLFPIFRIADCDNIELEYNRIELLTQQTLLNINYGVEDSKKLSNAFLEQLPKVYDLLLSDAEAIYQGDPAAESKEEVIISYPGFYAICIYRIAHELYKLKISILPRLFTEYAHKETGIDIHPGAKIANDFCIDHGTGIVIGETAIIGDHVKIYQGVTLGALSVTKDKAGVKRHPTIENNVTIYAGSTILGGETIVGNNSVIGGNVWLTHSVDPFSAVLNKSEVYVKDKNKSLKDVIDFVI